VLALVYKVIRWNVSRVQGVEGPGRTSEVETLRIIGDLGTEMVLRSVCVGDHGEQDD
jgi:hypothetical protein